MEKCSNHGEFNWKKRGRFAHRFRRKLRRHTGDLKKASNDPLPKPSSSALLRNLCAIVSVLCVSAVIIARTPKNRRDAKSAEVSQRRATAGVNRPSQLAMVDVPLVFADWQLTRRMRLK